MFRSILIVAGTLLGGATIWLSRDIPTKADMERPIKVLIGIGFFFMLFFAAVRFIDDYFWWTIPAVTFMAVIYYSVRKLGDTAALTEPDESNLWLAGVTAAVDDEKEKAVHEEDLDVMFWDNAAEPPDDGDFGVDRPRRFLDDYLIADEADLGPTPLELERLDEFIFTARHGYLIHDHDPDLMPCDVVTVTPRMSIADLIEIAQQHQCQTRDAEKVAA